MYQIFLLSIFFLSTSTLLHNASTEPISAAVTYDGACGRFGDQLIAYLHAKWVAFSFDIPLLYKPFIYSDQLMIHDKEEKFTPERARRFKKTVVFKKGDTVTIERNKPILYVIPYFPETLLEHAQKDSPYFYCKVDWKNKEFKNIIASLIKPRCKLSLLQPPSDKITVAVHVRKGGSFEKLNLGYPLKFPDDSYYIEQIEKIDDILDHQRLYVFLFTDDRNPQDILNYYKTSINRPNLQFDCRTTKNDCHINVLEDFFSMTQFDCIIYPDSNFSICASKLATYLIEISPKNYYINNDRSYITETEYFIDQEAIKNRYNDLVLKKKQL